MDILIVDDDLNICNLLQSYCEDLNLFQNIVVAVNGDDASLKIRNQVFNLVILDIHLPKKMYIFCFV